jgi:two-component system phosphate regulon sensor histidine kinase PhoR
MKKEIVFSLLGAFIVTMVYRILSYFISFTAINLILTLIAAFAVILGIMLYFKKQNEQTIIHHIQQQLKNLSAQTNLKTIDTINDLEKFIHQIILERKKEQEYFKNLDSYRKEYLGNVSHELKTPLFNVQGYVSTLLDGAANDKDILYEYLKKADNNIERMLNIIDDLETISHLESGAMILEYESFDIEQLISEVFEQMELSAKNKSISLQLIKEHPVYYIAHADKFRIRQVLINLISNSIKYGKEGGNTVVKLKKENSKIIVSVSDDGIGIEEKHLPRIFERFYRVDKGRSMAQGGTGLGLAIVKHIIEAHKQTIFVKSELGKGTTFTFTLDSK